MGAIATIATTIAATVGAIALYRFVDGRAKEIKRIFADARKAAEPGSAGAVIDYERDPATGVYKPKA